MGDAGGASADALLGRVGWRDNDVYELPTGEVVAVYSDRTDAMRAEDALRRSEARFRVIFEAALDAVCWADPATGWITRCDAAAEALHTAGELVDAVALLVVEGV